MLKRFKHWILWTTIPIQKWVQRRGRRETVITKEQVKRTMALARPGDILGSYEDQRWTSGFIKGEYDHAAIVTNKGTVMEAVGDLFRRQPKKYFWDCFPDYIRNEDGTRKNFGGVREVDMEEWLYKKDHHFLVRVNHPSAFAAGHGSFNYKGRGYDYTFSHDNEDIYCSELPYACWKPLFPEFLAEFEGDEILPQLYLDYSKHGIAAYLECLVDTRGF